MSPHRCYRQSSLSAIVASGSCRKVEYARPKLPPKRKNSITTMQLIFHIVLLFSLTTSGLCEDVRDAHVYDDCGDVARTFCLGMIGNKLAFAPERHISSSGSCIKDSDCHVLFKATKLDRMEEVVYKIYSVLHNDNTHDVYVTLTNKPIMGGKRSFPSGTEYMLGWGHRYKTPTTWVSRVYKYENGTDYVDNWYHSNLFLPIPYTSNVTYLIRGHSENQTVHVFTFFGSLKPEKDGAGELLADAKHESGLTGLISPAVFFTEVTYNATGHRVSNLLGGRTYKLPVMHLWVNSSTQAVQEHASAGGREVPLWAVPAIAVLIVALLIILFLMFLVWKCGW